MLRSQGLVLETTVSQTLKASCFLSGKAAADMDGNFPWESAGRAKIWKILRSYGVGNTVWSVGTMRGHLAFNINHNSPLSIPRISENYCQISVAYYLFLALEPPSWQKLVKTFRGEKKNRNGIVVALRGSLDVLQMNK